jgi:hypothetical protein
MRFINRQVPIDKVARALDLRLDGLTKIHCWHPERHKNGDRTASVGIRSINNTVKCFGCDSKNMGPIDLVMDVLETTAADAALWIAGLFNVPSIPARKRQTVESRPRGAVGRERGLGLLVRSGLWGTLSESAKAVAPVLEEFSEKTVNPGCEPTLRMSYVAICRFSGLRSPNAIRKALLELGELGFVRLPESGLRQHPSRQPSLYIVTPDSDELYEAANAFAARQRVEIEAERELRSRLRTDRIRCLAEGRKQSSGPCDNDRLR